MQTQRTVMTKHVPFAEKFGTAVDERCDADKIKIAAEVLVIEDVACLGQLDGLDCVYRCNSGSRRDTAQRRQSRPACQHRQKRQQHSVTDR